MSESKGLNRILVGAVTTLIAVTIAVELLLYGVFHHGGLYVSIFPDPLRTWVRKTYHERVERTLAVEPTIVRPDARLGYVFSPGKFSFQRPDHSASYEFNSKGFRSPEQSLAEPEVILLGDEFAFGYGVSAESLFANKLGANVLNAALPGYATTQQLRVLSQFINPKLKAVIVQYSPRQYATLRTDIPDELSLRNELQRRRELTHYKAGKYVQMLLPFLRGMPLPAIGSELVSQEREGEAEAFLAALASTAERKPDGVKWIGFEVVPYGAYRADFHAHIRKLQLDPLKSYPASVREMRWLDLNNALEPDNFFPLDGYLRASGHDRLAEHLRSALQRQ